MHHQGGGPARQRRREAERVAAEEVVHVAKMSEDAEQALMKDKEKDVTEKGNVLQIRQCHNWVEL